MLTNKDIRVENGNIVINGDKYPLDGQSPEAIMQIVEDNSDTTPTENSTAPITSGGVFAADKDIIDTIGDITQTGVTGADVASQIEAISDSLDIVNISLTSALPTGFTAGTPFSAYLTKVAPHLAFLTFNMRFSAVTTLSNFETFFTYTADITPDSTLGNCGKLLAPDGSYIEVSTGYGKGVIKFYSENVKANTFYRGSLPMLID